MKIRSFISHPLRSLAVINVAKSGQVSTVLKLTVVAWLEDNASKNCVSSGIRWYESEVRKERGDWLCIGGREGEEVEMGLIPVPINSVETSKAKFVMLHSCFMQIHFITYIKRQFWYANAIKSFIFSLSVHSYVYIVMVQWPLNVVQKTGKELKW